MFPNWWILKDEISPQQLLGLIVLCEAAGLSRHSYDHADSMYIAGVFDGGTCSVNWYIYYHAYPNPQYPLRVEVCYKELVEELTKRIKNDKLTKTLGDPGNVYQQTETGT